MTISEHTVDLSLLPEKANILDLGARGFLFTEALRALGHNVVPVDIDKLEGDYMQLAVSDYNGYAGIDKNRDAQATKIKEGKDVKCVTLEELGRITGVSFWDLIKIDIEGAEYQVIMSMKTAPAKQLSIEFHLHTGIYSQKEMKEMETKLFDLGYEAKQHELTEAHGAGYSYWDSLFILR